MYLDVKPGAVIINDIVCIINHPDVKVFHMDLRSKYPGDLGWVNDDDDEKESCVRIWIPVGYNDDDGKPYTMWLDETRMNFDTTVTIAGLPKDNWIVQAEGARYSVYVTMYRWRNPRPWWRRLFTRSVRVAWDREKTLPHWTSQAGDTARAHDQKLIESQE